MTENEQKAELACIIYAGQSFGIKSVKLAETIQAKGYRLVVRCKECKWFLPHKYIEGYDGNCDLSGCEVYNDDYCSRADMRGEKE